MEIENILAKNITAAGEKAAYDAASVNGSSLICRGCKFFCVYGGKVLPIRFRYVQYCVESWS